MSSVSFDRAAATYDQTRGGIERGRQFAERLDEHLQPESRLIEICVGTALVAAPLAELGHTVVGIDISRPMLTVAASRHRSLVEGDAAILPFATSSVDAVLGVWAVHLVGDLDGLFADVGRVLRPSGTFLVVSATPDVESNDATDIAYRMGSDLGRGWDRPEHLAARLEPHGFELVTDTDLGPEASEFTPTERAAEIEAKTYSALWDLDDETWATKVQPVIDGLRALPEPDRPRPLVERHKLGIYRAPG